MFPKIQKSRQACWPRFWRRAPAWDWASRSHCAFPLLDQSCWERCEESSQTAFIQPPDPLPPASLITQPTGTLNITPSGPDTHPSVWFSHSLMAFPATLLQIIFPSLFCSLISSPLIFIRLFSLSDISDNCVVIFQRKSIWKNWRRRKILANASYWSRLLWRESLFVEVDCSACCCPSLGFVSLESHCPASDCFVWYISQVLNCCTVKDHPL